MNPNLHPNGSCMPCCNKKPYKNFGKCMIINVDYKSDSLSIKKMKPGFQIGDYKLKINNTIIRGVKVYKVQKDGGVEVKEFTELKLPLQPGMTFNVSKTFDEKHRDEEKTVNVSYLLKEEDGYLSFELEDTPSHFDAKYVQNENKFPLTNGKLGLLPQKIDDMLGNNSERKIKKSNIINGKILFTRIGTFQDPNSSYLSAIAHMYGVEDIELYDAKYIIEKIISELDPLTFISLNGGELWRHFVDIDQPLTPPPYFSKWCKTYPKQWTFF